MSTVERQPALHDSVAILRAPCQAWSASNGEFTGGAHGFYVGDRRLVSRSSLTVGGEPPLAVSDAVCGVGEARFVSLARNVDDATPDPRVRMVRTRTVGDNGMREQLVLHNALAEPVATTVTVELGCDVATMQDVKHGRVGEGLRSVSSKDGSAFLEFDGGEATVLAADARVEPTSDGLAISWDVAIPGGSSATLGWSIEADVAATVVGAAHGAAPWGNASVASGDYRLEAWVTQALTDLDALRMETTHAPGEQFFAAGAPWYFTLFGRDSLWAARMMLPFGTEMAASTLRVLGALQGTTDVPETAEEPGKILHEVRDAVLEIAGEGVSLSPVYFGTVDATPLWVCTLVDAWRWGMPEGDVRALAPNLEAALAWMRNGGDSDGDGFLEYVDRTGHGLANQGWKDSGDSVQWVDGTLATGPIALCEVQAYAYEAAMGGADLLDALGRPGAESWREWARSLKQRFREQFWVTDAYGRTYPAIALDANKRPVDTITSNIGHLLGTGLLDADEERLVAARLVADDMDSGLGLRTMSADSGGYWPLSYHGGSVWAHDTAIAIQGLAKAGFGAEAATLAEGLLAAAEDFSFRMPELHAGDSRADAGVAVPYPASCRPQAWSAGAAVSVAMALTGVRLAGEALEASPPEGCAPTRIVGLKHRGAVYSVDTSAAAPLIKSS